MNYDDWKTQYPPEYEDAPEEEPEPEDVHYYPWMNRAPFDLPINSDLDD